MFTFDTVSEDPRVDVAAHSACTGKALQHDYPLSDLERLRYRRHWALLQRHDIMRWGWPQIPLDGDLRLSHHPDLRVKTYGDTASTRIVALGMPIAPCSPDSVDDLLRRALNDGHRELLRNLVSLAGVYAIILSSPGSCRIYTDPAGLMGVYYSSGRAASTPTLLPGCTRDASVDGLFRCNDVDDWYPGSLCPYLGVKALLANHWLDVGSGQVQRFWPVNEPPRLNTGEAVAQACNVLQKMMEGIVSGGKSMLSLTGGRDSRVVLAATRSLVNSVSLFTIQADGTAPDDITIPSQIAERFHLNHRIIRNEAAPVDVLKLYDEASAGMSVGARREIVGACWKLADTDFIHVGGTLGEVARAYYWPTVLPKRVTDNDLNPVLVNRSAPVRNALREWHDSVPDLSPATVFNLLYLEQRGGRWAGTGLAASNLFFESAALFSSRELFTAICGIDPAVQKSGQLPVAFVRNMWPELLDVSFGSTSRWWGRCLPKRMKVGFRRAFRWSR